MFLSQYAFAQEILTRDDMVTCNPSSTLANTKSKLTTNGDHVSDTTLYRSLVGAFQYLTFTRLDTAYVVQQVCLFMHDQCVLDFKVIKRILRYLKGIITHGLYISNLVVDH